MSAREWTDEQRQRQSRKMVGHVVSEEVRQRIAGAVTLTMSDPALRAQISVKVSNALRGHEVSEETRRRISETETGKVVSEDAKRQISESKRAFWDSRECEENRQALSKVHTNNAYRFGVTLSEETKQRISDTLRERWKDPEFVRRYSEAHQRKPNESELQLQSILGEHLPGEWKYIGDGTFWIGGRNPDFININGKKQVIEMFGLYWHDPDLFPNRPTEEALIAHYRQYGFDCLVLWEHEVWDERETLSKIKFALGG